MRNILGNKLADAEPLFSTLAAMAEMAGGDLPGLIERYEARRSGVDRDTIRAAVLGSWEIMKASMTDGLAGKSDMLAGLVPGDAGFRLARRVESGQALSGRTIGMAVAVRWRSWRTTVPCAVWWRLPRRGPAGCCPARFFRRLRNAGSATTPSSTGCSSRRRWAYSWPACPHFRGDRRLPVRNRRGFGHDGGGAGAAWRRDSGTGYPRGGIALKKSSRASSAILWPDRWKSHASSATPWASPTLSRRRTWPLPESPAAFLPTRWSTRSSTCRASFIPICAATCAGASPPPRRARALKDEWYARMKRMQA